MVNLKSLPISYNGILNDVKLIAFTVPKEEVLPGLPDGIEPVIENGRVMFSLVSVELTDMKASVLPIPFNYHHVAIRMCVKDSEHNESGDNQGVYFWQSYTNKPLMVAGGKMLTAYNLDNADIKLAEPVFQLRSADHFISFAIDLNAKKLGDQDLFKKIQKLDRAYFSTGDHIYRTRITRSEWPIKWTDCYVFETNLFQDVKVEGAFYIDHPIHYKWNKPELIS